MSEWHAWWYIIIIKLNILQTVPLIEKLFSQKHDTPHCGVEKIIHSHLTKKYFQDDQTNINLEHFIESFNSKHKLGHYE